MALIPTPLLTTRLSKAFQSMQPVIQTTLQLHFANPLPRHTALSVDEELRQGGIVENLSNSVYTVLEKVDKWAIENTPGEMDTVEKRAQYKHEIWTETSKAWADSLSEHISKDIVNALVTTLAPQLAEIINQQIKSASVNVIIPPGTVTVGIGAASTFNPVPIKLKIDPLIPLPNVLKNSVLTVPAFGGLE